MAERSEKAIASRQIKKLRFFDTKLRYAFLASLRSAIFIEIKVNNQLAALSARVKLSYNSEDKKEIPE